MAELIFDWKAYAEVARKMCAEGCVLLKNDEVLPIKKGSKVALFGRMQFHYYKSGTGSGGMVNAPYVVGILDALKERESVSINQELLATYEAWVAEHPFDKGEGWAAEPWCQEEMPLSKELVANAAKNSDVAVVILGRTAGEDQDNSIQEGSLLLTAAEEDMLQKVCASFEKVAVVLNVGNIIDMSFVEKYNPGAVLYAWQGGMEGGNGTVDVLLGDENPSGKLSDTIAYSMEDYPSTPYFGDGERNFYVEDIFVGYRYFETFAKDKVMYPFGYGLSYTSFFVERDVFEEDEEEISVGLVVTNTGDVAGKEVVQLYVSKPQGQLGQPARVLVGFAKTECLEPGESQVLMLSCKRSELASYDDSGVTGHAYAFVLEDGEYMFFAGTDVRNARPVGSMFVEKTEVVEQLEQAMAPVLPYERYHATLNEVCEVVLEKQQTPLRQYDRKERIATNRPSCEAYTGDKGYKLKDVYDKKVSMETFLAQLTENELICMSRGEGMCSPKVTPGTASCFGGVTESLVQYGIPVGCCADGPSGIRMDSGDQAFSMPNGTCVACSFNLELTETLYEFEGMDLRRNKVDTLLGPGINMHRSPMNGRNFEYFSEDPYLTGVMAVAQLHGMHKHGVTGTLKHFVCNDQEFHRHMADTVVSERAAREIYLKPFEYAVRQGNATCIMTTYGCVNGIWTAGNYDLNTTILRKEWGFDGIVMTDWWAMINEEGGEPSRDNTAPMIIAQNDVYMVVSDAYNNSAKDNARQAYDEGKLSRAELVRNAANICRTLLKMKTMDRQVNGPEEWKIVNAKEGTEMQVSYAKAYDFEDGTVIDLTDMPTDRGSVSSVDLVTTVRGHYDMIFKMKSDFSELAQMPVSIYNGSTLIGTISINGTNGEWIERSMELSCEVTLMNRLFFKFGQSGIQIGEVSFKLKDVFYK